MSFAPLFFILIPKYLGLPYGKQPLHQYLPNIKAGWLIKLSKILFWSILGLTLVYIPTFITNIGYVISSGIIAIDMRVFTVILYTNFIFWSELFYRGIVFTILLKHNRKKSSTIILNALLDLISSIIPQILMYPTLIFYYSTFVYLLIFLLQALLAYLCIKTKSIFPGIIIRVVLIVILNFEIIPNLFILGCKN